MLATLRAKNANEAIIMSGGCCIWGESRVMQSILYWCIWQESGFSHHEDVSMFNLVHTEIFMNFVLSVQFAKNAEINCITVQRKKCSFNRLLQVILC
jgi:hypothetical protein